MMVSGVPSGITLIDPLRLGGSPNIDIFDQGYREPKNVEKHCDGERRREREKEREEERGER